MRRPAALALAALLASTAACGNDDRPSLSWEAFRAQAYLEPETGAYVYDGDVVAADELALKRAWARHFAALRRTDVAFPMKAWSASEARRITYCVSLQFGNRHREVVSAMAAAAAEWEAEADVDFVHLTDEDFRCHVANDRVVFDVSPVFRAPSLARAFSPTDARPVRQLLIDDGAFDRSVSFVGLLRHELGHVLGLEHLHARPEAAPCFEDSAWRPPFETEAVSTMVYPSCDGRGDWELSITDHDRAAVRARYGPSSGTPSLPGTDGAPVVSGWLDAGSTAMHGPFVVAGRSDATFGLDATAGTTLLVSFDARPTLARFDARVDAGQARALRVPAGVRTAYVLVSSTDATDYDLFAPGGGGASGTTVSFTGLLAEDAHADHGPIDVSEARTLRVTVTGSGDPDLYVNFDGPVLEDSFACESLAEGADHCALSVPPGTTVAWVQVVGATQTSYTATVSLE